MVVKLELPPVVDDQTDVALDIEMFGQTLGRLHRPEGRFACLSIGIGDTVYVVLEESQLKEVFARIDKARSWVFHNALYDLRQLMRWVKIKPRFIWDTMNVDKCLWGGYYSIHEFSLADLSRRYLDTKLDKSTREQFAGAKYMDEDMLNYAAQDAWITLQIKQKQEEEIAKRNYDMHTYNEIEVPTMWTVLDFKPIKVNVNRWVEMVLEFEQRGIALEEQLGVNVYSHQQVKEYIRKKLGRRIDDTAYETLVGIGGELIEQILLARQLRKASSTYGIKWIEKYVEEGDLVYSDIYTIGTETGRPSSSNPNLLNIPARQIPEYRELFISDKGKLIVADIAAQEPRILAYLSGDKRLLQVFQDGKDVHLEVARAIFNDTSIRKSDKRREIGKTINLATSYGMTAMGMAQRLGITEQEAQSFLNKYFMRYPDVRNYVDRQHSQARRFEYVESITGRRVWVNPHSFQWQNVAVNAPIQSSAADFSKMWMNKLHQKYNGDFPVCLMVYDEIVIDVPEGEVELHKQNLLDAFNETAGELLEGVPMVLDVCVGDNWGAKNGGKE